MTIQKNFNPGSKKTVLNEIKMFEFCPKHLSVAAVKNPCSFFCGFKMNLDTGIFLESD